jgi:hypothetical protein
VPNFKNEIAMLKAKAERQARVIEKQTRTITQLRGSVSGLEYGHNELTKARWKDQRETTTTLTVFGQTTRTILEGLHEAGVDVVGEPLSRLPS